MDKIINNLKTLLTTAFGSDFKSYEYGDVEIAPTSDLPLLAIKPISTTVTGSGTVRDMNVFNIQVIVYISSKQYLNNINNNPSERATLSRLIEIVEDRNSNQNIKAKSVMGVIRQGITLSGAVLFNDELSVDYSEYITNAEYPVCKAVVSFTATTRTDRL